MGLLMFTASCSSRLDVIPIFDKEAFQRYRYQRRNVYRRHPSEVGLPISLHPSLHTVLDKRRVISRLFRCRADLDPQSKFASGYGLVVGVVTSFLFRNCLMLFNLKIRVIFVNRRNSLHHCYDVSYQC